MIHRQAVKLATGLTNKRVIDETSHEVYAYGFELIISALINVMLIAIVSSMFRRYYDWLLFLLAFIPLRTTAGGYHASTHAKCIAMGTIIFAVMLLLSRFQINWININSAIAVVSLVTIIVFSPVEARNKKLKAEQVKQNRRRSINIAIVNIALIIATFFIKELSNILSIYYLGIFSATLSMLVVKIKKCEDI